MKIGDRQTPGDGYAGRVCEEILIVFESDPMLLRVVIKEDLP